MDNSSGIKLFNDESPDIAMPSSNVIEDSMYTEDRLGDAIDGAMIQRVLIPTKSVLDTENYVLHFANIGTITVFQKDALKGLLYKGKKSNLKEELEKADREKVELITIYMYREGKDVTELGKGEKYHLEKALPLLKKYIFDDEIKVYKNYDETTQLAELISEEKVSYRLNL